MNAGHVATHHGVGASSFHASESVRRRRMSGVKEAVARVSDALDACIPQMQDSLQRRKEALRVPRLDVHTSQAELESCMQHDLPQIYERARKSCVDSRSDSYKTGMSDVVLTECL